MAAAALGLSGPLEPWLTLNTDGDYDDPAVAALLAPFPPTAFMQRTSSLTEPRDFASHGAVMVRALADASPKPLNALESILDFGVGAGRLARMFRGYPGRYAGVDIDAELVAWVADHLKFVDVRHIGVREKFPFATASFEAAISISVFTHMEQRDHIFYLRELQRVIRPGGYALLTVHGESALALAEGNPEVRDMLAMTDAELAEVRAAFTSGDGFRFVPQGAHLVQRGYRYGQTFANAAFVRRFYGRYFDLVRIVPGAIHGFQDIVVLQRPAVVKRSLAERLFWWR